MKTFTKLIISLCFVSIVCFFAINKINDKLPAFTVKQIFDHLISLDYETYIPLDELAIGEHEKQLLNATLKTMTYNIIQSRREDERAYVEVSITNVNLDDLLKNQKNMMLKEAITNWKSSLNDILTGGFQMLGIKTILNTLSDDSIEKTYKTTVVTIELLKQNHIWVPLVTDEVISAMAGVELSVEAVMNYIEEMDSK